MKIRDLRALSPAALADHIASLRADYGSRRESVRTGKEKNSAQLHQRRAELARALTVQRESRPARTDIARRTANGYPA